MKKDDILAALHEAFPSTAPTKPGRPRWTVFNETKPAYDPDRRMYLKLSPRTQVGVRCFINDFPDLTLAGLLRLSELTGTKDINYGNEWDGGWSEYTPGEGPETTLMLLGVTMED